MTRAPVFVVSGGVGASGEQLVRTALAQFEATGVPVEIVPRVRQVGQLQPVVDEAAARGGLLVHTLVDPDLRQALVGLAQEAGVVAIDLMGPLLDQLAAVLGQAPLGQPGRYRQIHAASFARVEAIEFALAHDDGRDPQGWSQAEIVLVGVSRAGKTPTSVYLAVLGWKVANVPLVPGMPAPEQLFALDRRRVVGLTVDPDQLAAYRRGRQQRLNMPLGAAYTDALAIEEEIEAARRIMRRGGFRVVDVTDKPVEQIADEVLRLVPAH